MATPLDVGLLSKFSIIFSMLFIFVVVYSVLSMTKLLGKNNGVNSIVALVTALMLLFAPNVAEVINIMIPWFILLLIFILMVYLLFRFMGASESDLTKVLKEYKAILWVIIVISVIIFLAALGKVFFSSETSDQNNFGNDNRPTIGKNGTIVPGDIAGPPGEATFWATFFHKKVLGMIFVLLIGMFALITLATSSEPKH